MPYQIYVERWRSKPFVVRRSDRPVGKAYGYHKTREEAEAQIKALLVARELSEGEPK